MKGKTKELSPSISELPTFGASQLSPKLPDENRVALQGVEGANAMKKQSDKLAKTKEVAFCRSHLPIALGNQLLALPRGLRGRTVSFIIQAHATGLDLRKLVESGAELRRLGVLLNQSLRVSRGTSVDLEALEDAIEKVKQMWP